jgi:hypothetical protein
VEALIEVETQVYRSKIIAPGLARKQPWFAEKQWEANTALNFLTSQIQM